LFGSWRRPDEFGTRPPVLSIQAALDRIEALERRVALLEAQVGDRP